MIKKIIAGVIVVLVIFCAVLCKKKLDSKQNLVFWSIQLKPIYEKELNKIIKDFENKHDIKITWVDIPIQEAQKRTLASILSSNPPDLVNLNPEFSLILAQRNALYTFSAADVAQYHKGLADKLMYEGKYYALPFYATSPVSVYNKELYKKCAGDNFIKNYDEMYIIAKDVKECAQLPVFASSLNENDTLAKILNKYNIKSMQDEFEIKKAIKVYTMFDEMYKNEYLPKDTLNINHREVIEKYMSNQAMIVQAGANFIDMIKQNAPDIYKKSEIARQLTGENNKYDVSLMNLIIPKKSKNFDLALLFAKELTNKDNQLQLSKLTNVLCANKEALLDDYFKNCSEDLVDKSRCLSASQLDNLNDIDFGVQNKKTINEEINKTLEEILLDKNSSSDSIKGRINDLSLHLSRLINSN